MRATLLFVGGIFLTGAMAVAQAQDGLAQPTVMRLPSGALRVVNAGPTAWADTSGWKLVFDRVVQPPEGDPGILQNPFAALLAADGRVITVDVRNPGVRLYSSAGSFVRMLGRAGDGPGEYRVPFAVLFADTLFIHDPPPRRLTVMTLDGRVARDFMTTANDYYPVYLDAAGRLAMRTSSRAEGRLRAYWVYHGRDGSRSDSIRVPASVAGRTWEYPSPEGTLRAPIPFGTTTEMHLLPTGTAVYGNTDRYELIMTRTGTDTVLLFSRVNPPLARISEAARDSALHAAVDRNEALRRVAKASDLPLTFPPWRTLHHDGEGNVWVGAPSERIQSSRFDVFSPDGRLLGSVAAPFSVYATVAFHGERLTVIDTDADDLPRIRIYRIERQQE